MKKTLCLFLCFCFSFFVFSGCTYSRQIDKLAFVKIIGIDSQNGKTILTVDVEDEKNHHYSVSTECDNIFQGISYLESKSPKNIFFGQIEVVLFGREYVENGIDDALNFFIQSDSIRFDIPIIVIREDTAQKIIEVCDEDDPSYEKILRLLDSSYATSVSGKVSISELISASVDDFSSPYLPYIVSNDNFILNGYCLLKGNQVSCFLDERQSRGFNVLNNSFDECVLIDNDLTASRIKNVGAKIKLIDGIFDIKIEFQVVALDKISDNERESYMNYAEKNITAWAEKAIEAMKENSCDGIGFGKVFYRTKPKEALETDWKNVFSQITIRLSSEGNFLK